MSALQEKEAARLNRQRILDLFRAISAEQVCQYRYGIKTLCDVCANAYGFCEWSKHGDMRPVPGWDAVRRDVATPMTKGGTDRITLEESYTVLHCPKFSLEEKWTAWYEKWDPEKRRRELECGAPESETE